MGRLIDADLLKKNCKCTGEFEDFFKCVSLSELAKVIDNQPTAFDAEKVTESLMNRFRVVSNDEDLEWNRAISSKSLQHCIFTKWLACTV